MIDTFAPQKQSLVLAAALFCIACSTPMVPSRGADSQGGLFIEAPRFRDANEDIYSAVVADVFSDERGMGGGCFSMVSLADGRPEEAVTVTCPVERSANASVEHLVAVESVAQRLRSSGAEAARHVEVKRSEASISGADARLLRELWVSMLVSASPETGVTIRESRRDYFFSALRPGLFRGVIGGVARNPTRETDAARLAQIGELLAVIADAPEQERSARLAALRVHASRLSKSLDAHR